MALISRVLVIATAAAMLASCASPPRSERVEFGGTYRPVDVAAPFSQCDDWRFDEFHVPEWSSRLVRFLLSDVGDFENGFRDIPVTMSYTILEDGSIVNIRLVEPMWYTSHASYREAPKTVAEALSQSSFAYEGDGAARPAVECRFQHTYSLGPNDNRANRD